MEHEPSLKQIQKLWHGTYFTYAAGFLASLLLTALSFYIVFSKAISGPTLKYTLMTLAFVQALFQLHFFLHLGQEAKPKWETVTFYFMVLILLIVVLGTLWIMYDLNERMMPGMEM